MTQPEQPERQNEQLYDLNEKARAFESLVASLRGLSDRQMSVLLAHGANAAKPDGERDEEMFAIFLDARCAALALDRTEKGR